MWKKVNLKSITEKTLQWKPAKEPRDFFYYIDVSSVSNETFSIKKPQKINAASAPGRARKIVKWQDTIYATIRPSLKRIAYISNEYDDQIASTAFCVIRPDRNKAFPLYIYYSLLSDSINSKIIELQHGASYPAVTDKDILNQSVPLPSLKEQEIIAAIFLKIQQAIEVQESIIEAAQELKKSTMQHVFTYGLRGEKTKETEIGRVPESWDVVGLKDVVTIERGKFTHRPRNDPAYYGGDIPFVQTGDIANSNGRITNYSQTLNELGLSVSKIFPKGTILITIAANIGDTGILEFDSAFPDSIIGLTPIGEINSYYLEYFLRTQKRKMVQLAPKGTQLNINIQFLRPWPVLCPTVEEQIEIAKAFQSIDNKIELHTTKRNVLKDLFKTMLNKLMTGEVRVRDFQIDVSETCALD